MKVVRFGVGSIYLTQKVTLRDKSVVSTGFSVTGQLCLFFILILYSFLSLGHIVSWLLPGESEIDYPVGPFDVCRGNGMSFSVYFIAILYPSLWSGVDQLGQHFTTAVFLIMMDSAAAFDVGEWSGSWLF